MRACVRVRTCVHVRACTHVCVRFEGELERKRSTRRHAHPGASTPSPGRARRRRPPPSSLCAHSPSPNQSEHDPRYAATQQNTPALCRYTQRFAACRVAATHTVHAGAGRRSGRPCALLEPMHRAGHSPRVSERDSPRHRGRRHESQTVNLAFQWDTELDGR